MIPNTARHRRWKVVAALALLNGCRGFAPVRLLRPLSPYRSSCRTSSQALNPLPISGSRRTDQVLLSSLDDSARPEWACHWMPTWLVAMRPAVQFLVAAALYVFHLAVLTQHGIVFPLQLFPNDKGRLQSIGLDSLAGMFSLGFLIYLRRATKNRGIPAVPPLRAGPTEQDAPWKFPQKHRQKTAACSLAGLALLVQAYFFTGRLTMFWEDALYSAAGMGIPMTVAMHRSLCVLLGHLTWVALGSIILSVVVRPQPFFGGGKGVTTGIYPRKTPKWKWYSNKWDTYWLWWTIGGYFVSSWLFNVADFFNLVLLPMEVFEDATEGVVSQLINPENNDLAASLVGYIAPCLTAPWWEEVLYRGFMLPAMCFFTGFWPSVFLSGIVFSAHHLSTTGALPLAVLGWIWAVVYAKSGNLLVTILIHAMWNSRVFLGSWLGL